MSQEAPRLQPAEAWRRCGARHAGSCSPQQHPHGGGTAQPTACRGFSPDLLGRVHPEGDPNQPPPWHHLRRPHGERATLPQPTLRPSLPPKVRRRRRHHAVPAAGGRRGRALPQPWRGGFFSPPPPPQEWYHPPSQKVLRECRHGGAAAGGQLMAASGIAEQAVLLTGREVRALPVRLCRSASGGKRRCPAVMP